MCLNISQTVICRAQSSGSFLPLATETKEKLIIAFLSLRLTVFINTLRLSVIKKPVIKINDLALTVKEIDLFMYGENKYLFYSSIKSPPQYGISLIVPWGV